ncbi:MAG: hypothetical protein M1819_000362 [Sarea resinae]|nr:MAG: hypothetical protein M1819_000362 [Sarea resinae]
MPQRLSVQRHRWRNGQPENDAVGCAAEAQARCTKSQYVDCDCTFHCHSRHDDCHVPIEPGREDQATTNWQVVQTLCIVEGEPLSQPFGESLKQQHTHPMSQSTTTAGSASDDASSPASSMEDPHGPHDFSEVDSDEGLQTDSESISSDPSEQTASALSESASASASASPRRLPDRDGSLPPPPLPAPEATSDFGSPPDFSALGLPPVNGPSPDAFYTTFDEYLRAQFPSDPPQASFHTNNTAPHLHSDPSYNTLDSDSIYGDLLADDSMAANTRSHDSSNPHGLIDLTRIPSHPDTMPRTANKRTIAEVNASDPATPSKGKRRKATPSSSASNAAGRKASSQVPSNAASIEEVDLVDVDDDASLSAALQKQRADQIQAQRQKGDESNRFGTMTCVICMEIPTDLTATDCGHLFCHTCLMEALIAGESQPGPQQAHSKCPVCRKRIRRQEKRGVKEIIPLELMRMPRKRIDKGKQPVKN